VNNELARAMHAQSGAERQRRARIIESEGERTSMQNYSEGVLKLRMFCNVSGTAVAA
jgi:regulator of protease activity HflC (stomatin/prohibitin superfamily)